MPFVKRRVCEHRGDEDRQPERDPQLLHRVVFGFVVEVGLHGGRAPHHVDERDRLGRQILAHDRVAGLGHPGEIFLARERMKPDPQPDELFGIADLVQLGQVRAGLGGDLVHRLEWCTRELELPAWLEGDRGVVALEGDEGAARRFADRLPAEALLKSTEHTDDAPISFVGMAPLVSASTPIFSASAPTRHLSRGFMASWNGKSRSSRDRGGIGAPRFYDTKATSASDSYRFVWGVMAWLTSTELPIVRPHLLRGRSRASARDELPIEEPNAANQEVEE